MDRASRGRVLDTFVRDGKVRQLPAKWSRRRIVLEHVVTSFEPGVKYPELAVNAILRHWYDDYCALRRYLVDEELMARERGVYWRTGGPTWAPEASRSSVGRSRVLPPMSWARASPS